LVFLDARVAQRRDDHVHVSDTLMIVASATVNNPEQQPATKAFVLSVTEETVRVEANRSDGREVFATLRFDGERFSLVSESLG
jgi:hypothetical protein